MNFLKAALWYIPQHTECTSSWHPGEHEKETDWTKSSKADRVVWDCNSSRCLDGTAGLRPSFDVDVETDQPICGQWSRGGSPCQLQVFVQCELGHLSPCHQRENNGFGFGPGARLYRDVPKVFHTRLWQGECLPVMRWSLSYVYDGVLVTCPYTRMFAG